MFLSIQNHVEEINYYSPQAVVGIFVLILISHFALEESHQNHRPTIQMHHVQILLCIPHYICSET